MSDQTNAAYMAGIMDGEGSFSITRCLAKTKQVSGNITEGFHYQIQMTVANTNRPILDWMMSHFGGNVYTAARMPSVRCKQRYDWKLNNFKACEEFILAILPYLRIKRSQALIALEFCRMTGQRDPIKRAELRQRMVSANDSCKRPETLTTNTPNRTHWCKPVAQVLSKEKAAKLLMIESELHGDMQSASVVTQNSESSMALAPPNVIARISDIA